ncbi:hypothetical protein ACFLUV_03890 [Elusimicrobiota bacterium]
MRIKTKLKLNKVAFTAYLIIAWINLGPINATGYGTAGARILNLDSCARINARGNAHAGLADDINSLVYNPAGLINIKKYEFQFTRMNHFLNTGGNAAACAALIGKTGIGFKLKLFSAKDTYRDSRGYNRKTFSINYTQYTFGIGHMLNTAHSIGISADIVTENYGLKTIEEYGKDKTGMSISYNAGWLYKKTKKDSFGLTVKNLGKGFEVNNKESDLPLKYTLGSSHKRGKFLFVCELFTGNEFQFGWQCGLQADLNRFEIRSGMVYITNPVLSLGFGLPLGNWALDYAFCPHFDLGAAHRLSLGVSFR